MKNLLCLCLAVTILTTAFGSTNALESSVPPNKTMTEQYENLSREMERLLRETAGNIVAIPELKRAYPEWKAVRNCKTKLWLKLFDSIDRVKDSNFNFDDRPSFNVAPPNFAGDSGIDPTTIKDPSDRRAYEEAIRKNKEKGFVYSFQLDLQRQDEQYTTQAISYLTSVYSKTPEDAQELTKALNEFLTSQARRDQMKSALHGILSTISEPTK